MIHGLTAVPESMLPSEKSIHKSQDTDFVREEQEREAERLRSTAQLPELNGGELEIILVPHKLVLYVLADGVVIWEESSIGCGPTAVPRIERIVREKYGKQIGSFRSHLIYE